MDRYADLAEHHNHDEDPHLRVGWPDDLDYVELGDPDLPAWESDPDGYADVWAAHTHEAAERVWRQIHRSDDLVSE
jgi:hypothetical protein